MSFNDIERVIGTALPESSKKYPAWWSNNPSNNVMTRFWLQAGFQTERVDVPGRRLVFRRLKPGPGTNQPAALAARSADRPHRRHPIFGCMGGTIRVSTDVDLTEPADPTWGAQ